MQWFANLKTQTKILGTFGLVALMIGALAFQVIRDVSIVEHDLNVVYVDYTVPAISMGHMATEVVRYRDNIDHIIASKSIAEGREHSSEQPAMKAKILKALDDYGSTVLRVSRSGKSETQALEAFRKSIGSYFLTSEQVVQTIEQSLGAPNAETAHALKEKAVELSEKQGAVQLETAMHDLEEVIDAMAAVGADMNDEGVASANEARNGIRLLDRGNFPN